MADSLTSKERTNPHVRWLREAARHLAETKQTSLAHTCEGAAREIEAMERRLYPDGEDAIERLTQELAGAQQDLSTARPAIATLKAVRADNEQKTGRLLAALEKIASGQLNPVAPLHRVDCIQIAKEALSGDPASAHETEDNPTQKAVLKWAVDSFGPIALNRDERAARLVEEAVEVAQVEGVRAEVVQRILARVYSRPPGELGQEIGGCGITLLALAENAGIDHDTEVLREWRRVLSKPRNWWERKHAEKVAAGTANLSPTSPLNGEAKP